MENSQFPLELTRPWLLCGLLSLGVLLFYDLHSLLPERGWRRQLSLATRCLVVTLVVLALAGLTWFSPTRRQMVVFVTDDSLSVGNEAREVARRFVAEACRHQGGHEARFLTFAGQPQSVETELQLPPCGLESDAPRLATDLSAAIRFAAASLPPSYVKRLVLLSDGNQTQGDAAQAALALGLPVFTVPLPARREPEVLVSAVNVPAQVRQGEPFEVEVVIHSNHDDEGFVDIFRGSHKLSDGRASPVKISAGENRFTFRSEGTDQQLLQFTARLRDFDDRQLDNNSASGLVAAVGKPRVLLIASQPQSTRELRWALQEQDILVDVRSPEGTPETLAELQNYELVMLSNVPATSLNQRHMAALRVYVQQLGGGLIMLGGDQSFGLGGYYKTPLEEILPLRSDLEKEKEKPSLAMVLVIDKSGSMGGLKLDLAKDAARAAVELLGPQDQIGVVAFDGASYWVSELRSAADKSHLNSRLGTLDASGGTNIYPALDEAYQSLLATVAKLKHVILLTDGHSAPGDFAGLAQRMAAARITVSTVGVGDDADQQLLKTLARRGSGRYYGCDDPQAIPQIFAKETMTASRSALNEEPFLPLLIRPTPVLNQIDLESAPFLLGLVATRAKPTSELILAADTGEPLLAWWRYGLGMTAAFTSDATSRWASEWLSWPDFGPFWAQIVRHVMRRSDTEGAVVELSRQGPFAELTVDAVDALGQFLNQADTNLTVIDPQLGHRRLSVPQVAPGRYRVRFELAQRGTYHLQVDQRVTGAAAFRQSRGLVVGYPDELRLRPTNEQLLREVALTSGGRFRPRPAEVFLNDGATARRSRTLWPYLLGAATLLFVLDVGLRRIGDARWPRMERGDR